MRLCAALTYVMVSVRRGGDGGVKQEGEKRRVMSSCCCTAALLYTLPSCACTGASVQHSVRPSASMQTCLHVQKKKRNKGLFVEGTINFSVVLQKPKADMHVLQIFTASLGASP